jgi:hypothetical protein
VSKLKTPRDEEISDFRTALERLVGPGAFDPAMAGDLGDLKMTLERGVDCLERLLSMPPNDLDKGWQAVLRIQSLIEDELPAISKDLTPAIRAAIRKSRMRRSP